MIKQKIWQQKADSYYQGDPIYEIQLFDTFKQL